VKDAFLLQPISLHHQNIKELLQLITKKMHLDVHRDIVNFQLIECLITKTTKIRSDAFAQIVKLLLRKLMNGLILGKENVVVEVVVVIELDEDGKEATAIVQVTVHQVVQEVHVRLPNLQDRQRDVRDLSLNVQLDKLENLFEVEVAVHHLNDDSRHLVSYKM
jgi:hypothetical protein